jgi:hypothetical protein
MALIVYITSGKNIDYLLVNSSFALHKNKQVFGSGLKILNSFFQNFFPN